jgi:hypothetical protein
VVWEGWRREAPPYPDQPPYSRTPYNEETDEVIREGDDLAEIID